MNFGAWYPPTTFPASPAFNASSHASYRGGYSASSTSTLPTFTGTAVNPPTTLTPPTYAGAGHNLGAIYGQYMTSPYNTVNTYTANNAIANISNNNPGLGQNIGHGTTAGRSGTPGAYTPAASTTDRNDRAGAASSEINAALAGMSLNN